MFDKLCNYLFNSYLHFFSIYREPSDIAYLDKSNFEYAMHYSSRYLLMLLVIPMLTVYSIILDLIIPSISSGALFFGFIPVFIISWILTDKIGNYYKKNMFAELKMVNQKSYSFRQKVLAFMRYMGWTVFWMALGCFYFFVKYHFVSFHK